MDTVGVSVEDTFALVDMNSDETLFAHPFALSKLAVAAEQLETKWNFFWDFRRLEGPIWRDIVDALQEADSWARGNRRPAVISRPETVDEVRETLRVDRVIAARAKPLDTRAIRLDSDDSLENLDDLDELIDFRSVVDANRDWRELAAMRADYLGDRPGRTIIPGRKRNWSDEEAELEDLREYSREAELERFYESFEGFAEVRDDITHSQARRLDEILTSFRRESLPTELALYVHHDRISVAPYYASSIHSVIGIRDELVPMRPARLRMPRNPVTQDALREFEMLLNEEHATERDLERLLLRHPVFFRGLNYRSVYSQVVLPRGGAGDLRPDIIAEPFGEGWADIVELKRPQAVVLVGRENRARLAAALHEAIAQLREYQAFFDDRRAAAEVEARYGFKCYRPRLVVIVGRDPTGYSPNEMRRATTAFSGLEIVTYDRLLRAARELPLL